MIRVTQGNTEGSQYLAMIEENINKEREFISTLNEYNFVNVDKQEELKNLLKIATANLNFLRTWKQALSGRNNQNAQLADRVSNVLCTQIEISESIIAWDTKLNEINAKVSNAAVFYSNMGNKLNSRKNLLASLGQELSNNLKNSEYFTGDSVLLNINNIKSENHIDMYKLRERRKSVIIIGSEDLKNKINIALNNLEKKCKGLDEELEKMREKILDLQKDKTSSIGLSMFSEQIQDECTVFHSLVENWIEQGIGPDEVSVCQQVADYKKWCAQTGETLSEVCSILPTDPPNLENLKRNMVKLHEQCVEELDRAEACLVRHNLLSEKNHLFTTNLK